MITTMTGDHIEVATLSDIDAGFNAQAARVLRWFLSGGAVLLFGLLASWARFDARLGAVETRAANNSQAVGEIRVLVKKVDSLTIVLGNQTELLRDIARNRR